MYACLTLFLNAALIWPIRKHFADSSDEIPRLITVTSMQALYKT
jgi:hypothetical protein